MPPKSSAQKHMACMALAYKRHGASQIKNVSNKEAIIKMANSMSEEDLKHFCLEKVQ